MKAKVYSLNTEGSEILKTLEVNEFKIGSSSQPLVKTLAIEDATSFAREYLRIILAGDVPLILNPGIPEHKINEIEAFVTQSEVMSGEHILFSSGTTSKGLFGKKFIFKIEDALRNGEAHLESLRIFDPSRILLPLPLSHSFGLVAGLLASLQGDHELFTMNPGSSSKDLLNAIEIFNIDHLYLTPSQLLMMKRFLGRKKKVQFSPKSISIGSSLLFIEDLLSLMSFFPETHFYFTYGLTEMGPRSFTFDAGLGKNPHSYLLKEKTGPVPIGEVIKGVEYKISEEELLIKSPYQAINISRDFYGTKDRADLCLAGVRVHGRMDFTIIKGGINIYPAEIESLLSGFPGIISCALIPLKSESYGQVPLLIVHCESADNEITTRITEFLKKNLPATHLPSRIVLRENDFPRTSMGKIKVSALVDEWDDE